MQYNNISYKTIISLINNRIVNETNRVLILNLLVYPDQHPFLRGKETGIKSILNGKKKELDIMPMYYIPQKYYGNYKSTFNSAFYGTSWANWGYTGVVIETLLIFLIALITFLKWNSYNNIENRLTISYVLFGKFNLIWTTPLSTALNHFGLIWIIIIIFILKEETK